ncbi:MAG: SGNH/GDSL hydrolase family protein [Rhodospirillales bacterium]|nr:SGNH/GDSL hydrolase family protein [Rhodospirillales bacterium]
MRGSVFAGAAVVAGALIIGILVLEGVLRLAGISYPDFFRDDAEIGRALRPDASGWWTSEGNAYIEINTDGLRDRAHTLDKPARTLRIAVLGDSYAAAFEVPMRQTFWSEMQRDLEGCPALAGRPVEVINFGLGGAGTAQELLILRKRVWKYAPDIVLLAVTTGNDVSDNSRALKGSSRAPYFIFDANGDLVLDPVFVEKSQDMHEGRLEGGWEWLLNRSRVLQVVMQAYRQFRLMLRADQANTPTGGELGLFDAVYRPPQTAVWRDAWRVTEALVHTMAAEVREHGALFVLASLSNGVQVDPDPAVRRRSAELVGADDLFYPDRRFAAMADAAGVPSITLGPDLAAWAEANQTCVHGFANALPCRGHWNENGHKLGGEILASALCRDILPKRLAGEASER